MAVDFTICDHAGDGVLRCTIGDIICVSDGRHTLTVPITGPFRVIRITDLTVEQVLKYQEAHTTGSGDDYTVVNKRLWMLDPAKMTTPQRNSWDANRYIEATVQQARRWVKNKATGQYEG